MLRRNSRVNKKGFKQIFSSDLIFYLNITYINKFTVLYILIFYTNSLRDAQFENKKKLISKVSFILSLTGDNVKYFFT